jgi:hypothetical protein
MEMKMEKSNCKKDKVNYSIYFLLSRLESVTEAPLIENLIVDDLNEICDMTYSIKKMNEFSFIEI